MNQTAEDELTAMLNSFPQTKQNYPLLLATFEQRLEGISDKAIINAAKRFMDGDVPGQSTAFAPSVADFKQEARRLHTLYIDLNKPRQVSYAPLYSRTPLMDRIEKLKRDNADRQVLFEDVDNDRWKKLSGQQLVPEGASWVAALGTVYGPRAKGVRP